MALDPTNNIEIKKPVSQPSSKPEANTTKAAESTSSVWSDTVDYAKSFSDSTGLTSIFGVVKQGANVATLDYFDWDNNGSGDVAGAAGNFIGKALTAPVEIVSTWGKGLLTGSSADTTNQPFRNQVNSTLSGVNGSGYTGTTGTTGTTTNGNAVSGTANQSTGGILGAFGNILSMLFGSGQTQAAGQSAGQSAAQSAGRAAGQSAGASAGSGGYGASMDDLSSLLGKAVGQLNSSSSSMPTAGNPTTETEAQKQVDDINTALAKESAAVKAEEGQVEKSKVASEEAAKAEGNAKTGVGKAEDDLKNHLTTEPKKDDPKYQKTVTKDGKQVQEFDQAAYDADMKVFNETKTKLEGLVKEAKTKYEQAQVKTKDTKAAYEQNQKELKTAQDTVTRLEAELKIATQNLAKFKPTENKGAQSAASTTPAVANEGATLAASTPEAGPKTAGSGEKLIQLNDIPDNVKQYLTEAKGGGYTPAEVAEAEKKADAAKMGQDVIDAETDVDDTDAIQEGAQNIANNGDNNEPAIGEDDTDAIQEGAQNIANNGDNNEPAIGEDDTDAIQEGAQNIANNGDNNEPAIGEDDSEAIQQATEEQNAKEMQQNERPLQNSKTYELNNRKGQLENEVKSFEELAKSIGAKNYKNTEKYQALQNELGQINGELGTRNSEIQAKHAVVQKNSEIKAANQAIDEQIKPLATQRDYLQRQQKAILSLMNIAMTENKSNGLDPRDSARYRELQGDYDRVITQLGKVSASIHTLESKKQPLES